MTLISGTAFAICSKSKGHNAPVAGSLTIPMVPPVYIINTDFVIVISKFIDDPSHVFALQIKQIQSILCRYFFNFFCLETR